nr:unnamed protein product [Digitaria exilis]
MELGSMRLRFCQLPPNTNQPPPRALSFVARPRDGHLAVLRGRPCPHRARAPPRIAAPDSNPLETICTNNVGLGTKLSGNKFFPVEMTVRDCDLDQYGVVNNAVYAYYIEKANNVTVPSAREERGARFVVMVRVVQIKGTRMLVEHTVETLPERKVLVLEATATVVCLNKDYRPTRMFPEVASKVLRFFSS